ncbi:MAG: hypothetical protein SFW66_03235 [Gammaproteobacteria bacterium]|nr:hypothetical protein [Gammaproteobacteria bacterium]
MNNQDLYKLCREKNAEALTDFLGANIKMLSYKILATAVLQVHCPESKITLSEWDEKLRPGLVAGFDNMMNSAVNLPDFIHAHYMAGNELNDPGVADAICHYVQENKNVLGQILNAPETAACFPTEVKEQLKERVGDLSVSADAKFVYKSKRGAKPETLFDMIKREQTKFAASMSSGVTIEKESDRETSLSPRR